MAAALPRCIATESLCKRKWRERGSPVSISRRRPNSRMNEKASGPITPEVSIAMGTKWWLAARWNIFLSYSALPAQQQPLPLLLQEACKRERRCEGMWRPKPGPGLLPWYNGDPIRSLAVRARTSSGLKKRRNFSRCQGSLCQVMTAAWLG